MPILLDPVADETGAPSYGATVADVKALLPHRRWVPGVKPDEADVEGYIRSVASVLDMHVERFNTDPPPTGVDADVAQRLVNLAKRAVVLGAAAHADAAGSPERAKPNAPSSYAEWLMERYQEAVAEAEGYAAGIIAGDVTGLGDLDAEPAWSFPEPASWAARGI